MEKKQDPIDLDVKEYTGKRAAAKNAGESSRVSGSERRRSGRENGRG